MLLKKNINHKLWTDFISKTSQNNIYSHYLYLKNLKSKFNNFVLYEKELPLIGAILYDDDLGKIPTFYNSLFISNKIKSPHKLNQVCTEFINQLLKYNNKIHIRLHSSVNDIRSFQWHNYDLDISKKFDIKVYYTSILNIQNLNEKNILKTFNSSRSSLIKSALKNNFYSKISNDIDLLNDLNNKTFKRKRSKNELNQMLSKSKRCSRNLLVEMTLFCFQ